MVVIPFHVRVLRSGNPAVPPCSVASLLRSGLRAGLLIVDGVVAAGAADVGAVLVVAFLARTGGRNLLVVADVGLTLVGFIAGSAHGANLPAPQPD